MMVPAGLPRAAAAACLLWTAAACNDSTPPTTPPPTVTNTPPSIAAVTIGATRAEAGQPVQVTASVSDAETPVAQLTYTWSAAPVNGLFSGTGPTVTWTPPVGQSTPAVYTITLTVGESYTSGGQPRQNSATLSSTVRYHDSRAEMLALANQFLLDYGNYETTPEQCVRNFTDSCAGKEQEREEIASDRAEVRIHSAGFTEAPSVSMSGNLTFGTVEGACQFIDEELFGPDAGRRRSVTGTCVLTTRYENDRWWLCESFFQEPFGGGFLSFRDRHRFRPSPR